MSQSRGVQSTLPSSKQGSIFMLPFFLFSCLLSLPSLLAKIADENSNLAYPLRANRYNEYGWNRNAQHCYTEQEITLLNHIQETYHTLLDKDDTIFFRLKTDKYWREWAECTQPFYQQLIKNLDLGFTLPALEKQDSNHFPLAEFADNMARLIANWQAERSKNQAVETMNDPVMLIFEELKNWFFLDLTQQECRIETLQIISKRLGYIKTLIHLIPDFGLDKPRLLEIQRSLDHAMALIKNCVANKELPQLLSDVSRTGANFEDNIFKTLHFLPINEKVADNFSKECLDGKVSTTDSPICKIYKAAQKTDGGIMQYEYPSLHQFYSVVKLDSAASPSQFKLQLRTDVADAINFANFFNEKDRLNYIEIIATLDALMNVRKLLDKFHSLQSKLGTYVFAINYIDQANELASLYTQLLTKINNLIHGLIYSVEIGHEKILRLQDKSNKHEYFRKNLRTLETLVVTKGTTVAAKIEQDCHQAIESMEKYQGALRKLANDVQSGHAYDELKIAIQELDQQMQYMNTILPGILNDKVIFDQQSGLVSHEDNTRSTLKFVPNIAKKIPEETEALSAPFQTIAISHTDTALTQFNFFSQRSNTNQSAFDYAEWDNNVKFHPKTREPVHTLNLVKNGHVVGTAEFYRERLLCFSEDKSRHNIIALTGILKDFQIDGLNIEEVCVTLPPTLFDEVFCSAGRGVLLGTSNVIAASLRTQGLSPRTSFAIAKIAYYGSIFGIKFSHYYAQLQESNDANDAINAFFAAALETGQLVLINSAFNIGNHLLAMLGNYLKTLHFDWLGTSIKHAGSLLKWIGFYALNSNDLTETSLCLLTGVAAETITETTGNYLLGN